MKRLFAPIVLVCVAVGLGLFVLSPGTTHTSIATNGTSAVLADAPSLDSSASLAEGQTLFEQTCSSCHGVDAQGSALAPNLRGLGAATVDLWVSSGWMPLRNPTSQPIRKPPYFDPTQTKDIANFVGSLAGGPPIPTVDLSGASVSEGFSLFALNCAPCHTITGAGDALSDGISAPSLYDVTELQIAEAVRTGPGNMPRFGPGELSKAQLDDVISYVTKDIEHPDDPGGIGLGGVGPVAEGFVGLFVGVGVCMLIALWIGERGKRDEIEQDADHQGGGEPAHD
jgi:ubiquinol-cytochrome c reductase cytochrome c subunit